MLENETEKRATFEKKSNELQGQKTLLINESIHTKLNHEKLKVKNNELKTKITEFEHNTSTATSLIQDLNDSKSRLVSEINQSATEIQSHREEIAKGQLLVSEYLKNKVSLEHKIEDMAVLVSSLQNERSMLMEEATASSNEIALKEIEGLNREIRSKLEIIEERTTLIEEQNTSITNLEKSNVLLKLKQQSNQESIKTLVNDINAEKKNRLTVEEEKKFHIQEKLKLNELYEESQNRISRYTAHVEELESEFVELQTNHMILIMNHASEKDLRTQSNAKATEANAECARLQRDLDDDRSARLGLLEKLKVNCVHSTTLELELNKSKMGSDGLRERIEDLERENETLQSKIDATKQPILRENSIDKTRGKSTDKLFSKTRMSGLFFKSRESMLDSPDKNSASHDEVNDHKRMLTHQSYQSMDSMKSALAALLKTPQLTVLDFFNPMDGLQGWVKVPKGGKVKKGWKKIYVALSQDRIFSYESQTDFEQMGEVRGTLICDLSCEIFVARSVSQNELIHANARDIDLIFKIQAYTHLNTDNADREVTV